MQTSSDIMVTQLGLSGALFVATVGSGKKAGAEDGKAAIIKTISYKIMLKKNFRNNNYPGSLIIDKNFFSL